VNVGIHIQDRISQNLSMYFGTYIMDYFSTNKLEFASSDIDIAVNCLVKLEIVTASHFHLIDADFSVSQSI
jgi:hypothetical protein